jgi:hypothetical protein
MATTKQTTNRKRRSKAGPVLGAAGLSLSLAGAASAAAGTPAPQMLTRPALVGHAVTLRDEEIGDVSLATFYVFDRDNASTPKANLRLAMGACGAGCGCGCYSCAGCWTGTNYTSSVIGGGAYAPHDAGRPVHRHKHHASKRAKNR